MNNTKTILFASLIASLILVPAGISNADATLDIIDTIAVGDNSPHGLAFDSANNRVYVVNWNSISVIDTATNTVIDTIDFQYNPRDITFDSANNRVYVVNWGDDFITDNWNDTVSAIDTATNTLIAEIGTIAVGDNPRDITFDSTNNRVYVTNSGDSTVSVIDTATNTVIATIAVGTTPRGLTFDSANNMVYVTNSGDNTVSAIDTATNTVIGTIAVGVDPRDITFDSANNMVYVTNSGDSTVSVIDTATNTVIATIAVGDNPRGLTFDSANNMVYVTNSGDNTVSAIDTATNTVIGTIAVGVDPRDITFDSANNMVYVTNFGDSTVSVLVDNTPLPPATILISQGSSVPGCEVTNSCFTPADITINSGDTVEWNNIDSAVHTVTSGTPTDGPSGEFDSNILYPSTTFAFTFEDAGEYDYFCMLHPWAKGLIIVLEEETDDTTITWQNDIGLSIDNNDLTKTAPNGWDAGASSVQSLPSGDGYVITIMAETNTQRLIGLSNGDTNQSYLDVDFSIYANSDGSILVLEGGANRGPVGVYQTGDILKVAVESGVVKYYQNDSLLYTSSVSPVYPLLVDTSLNHNGATLKDVHIGGINWN